MFRWISIIGFAVVFAGIFLHCLIFPCGYKPRFSLKSLIRKKVHLLTLLFLEQKLSLPGKIRKLFFLLGLLSFLVLLVTGFGPLIFGHKLEGYLLMVHAAFAPVFIGCAAIVVFLGAGQYAFNNKDTENLPHGCLRSNNKNCWLTDTGLGTKAGFWLLAMMTLPVTLTMVLSMLPLYGPKWQDFMFALHRYCSLIFALIAVIELYILGRMRILEDLHGRRNEPKK
jgi:hypothetical protein